MGQGSAGGLVALNSFRTPAKSYMKIAQFPPPQSCETILDPQPYKSLLPQPVAHKPTLQTPEAPKPECHSAAKTNLREVKVNDAFRGQVL